jgi:Effector Associated Constant Component 1
MGRVNSERVELAVSDQSQIGPLQQFLSWAAPDAGVSRIPGRPGVGEQGALDVLAVLASSSGLVAAIRVLPEFLRSRKAGLSITMMVRGAPFTLTATNIDDVMPVLERLLDD